MPLDRLSELRRQRAQIADHLAWLDREIESCSGTSLPQPAVTPPTTPPAPAAPAATGETAVPEAVPADILHQYHEEAAASPAAARSGCLIFCTAVSAAVALVLFAIYWFGYR